MKYLLLLAVVVLSLDVSAQGGRKSPHETVSTDNISVTYGRPYKKGRDIFGELEPYGKVWRVGADEATEITFKNDVKFAGQGVKAGTYTLFAMLNENEWVLILNSKLGQWGSYDYEKNKSFDVVQVKVPVKKLTTPIEQHTIRFPDANTMIIEWDDAQVSVPIH